MTDRSYPLDVVDWEKTTEYKDSLFGGTTAATMNGVNTMYRLHRCIDIAEIT